MLAKLAMRPPSSEVRLVLENQDALADWPDEETMQQLLVEHERWHRLLGAPKLQAHNLDAEPVRTHSLIVWDTARWRAVGAQLPLPEPTQETIEAVELAVLITPSP